MKRSHKRKPKLLFALLLVSQMLGCAVFSGPQQSRIHHISKEIRPSKDNKPLPKTTTLNDYIAFALRHHPKIAAEFARWELQSQRTKTAFLWKDLHISYAFGVLPVETRLGPQRHKISLRQTLPWPGLEASAQNVQRSRTNAQQASYLSALLMVRHNVARTYWEIWCLEREEDLIAYHMQLLDGLTQSLRARLEVGKGSASSLTQSQLKLSQLRNQQKRYESQLKAEKERFLGLLGSEQKKLPQVDKKLSPKAKLPKLGLKELLAQSLAHPDLKRHRYLEQMALKEAEYKRTKNRPKITLGLDYIEVGHPGAAQAVHASDPSELGRDAFNVGVGLSIPLWLNQYESEVAVAQKKAQVHQKERKSAKLKLQSEVRRTLKLIQDASRRIEYYESTLIPQAQTNYKTARGDFETQKTSIASLLLAQRQLLDISLQKHRAQSSLQKLWSRLELLVGRPIEAK